MGIKFDFFEAGCGDSIWIETDNTNILIDGGFSYTYEDILKKYSSLDENNKLDLVVLTHNDKDHILGLIELIKYEKERLYSDKNSESLIGEVWFNSLDFDYPNIQDISKYSTTSKEQLISFTNLMRDKDNRIPYVENISIDNKNFQKSILINNDIEIILLSPNNDKLDKLLSEKSTDENKDYSDYLKKIDRNTANITQYYSTDKNESISNLVKKEFEPDNATPNGSSIAFILIFESKKYLFLADAHIPLIVEELVKYKDFFNDKERIEFEFIKLSHHGSKHNINQDFLDLIESDNFIILTNGSSHRHPDKETLARIILNCNRDFNKEINFICNYKNIFEHNKFTCTEIKEKNFILIHSSFYPLKEHKIRKCDESQ